MHMASGPGQVVRDGVLGNRRAPAVAFESHPNEVAFQDGVLGGALGATMASGQARAYGDGIFSSGAGKGATMRSGQGRAFEDGVLGAVMASGPGREYQDGVLGQTMASGPGHAFRGGVFDTRWAMRAGRDGVLGAVDSGDTVAMAVVGVLALGAGWLACRLS